MRSVQVARDPVMARLRVRAAREWSRREAVAIEVAPDVSFRCAPGRRDPSSRVHHLHCVMITVHHTLCAIVEGALTCVACSWCRAPLRLLRC